jgi:hypothetical protein
VLDDLRFGKRRWSRSSKNPGQRLLIVICPRPPPGLSRQDRFDNSTAVNPKDGLSSKPGYKRHGYRYPSGFGNAYPEVVGNAHPEVVGNAHPEVVGNDDTDVVVHKNKQLYPPLVIVPGELLPRLLSEVLAEHRVAQTEQADFDWPIDPELLNPAAPILEAAAPQGASVHPGPNAVAPLVLNAAAPQGGPANLPHLVILSTSLQQGGLATQGLQHASTSSLNMMLHQGGPATHGLQPGPQSVFNLQVALGGLPVLQLPVQQVQQQPAVQARQSGAQRSTDDRRRFPTAEALQAGALPALAGGATSAMIYRPCRDKHNMQATKWYHGYQVEPNGVPDWKCVYCECSTSDPKAERKI